MLQSQLPDLSSCALSADAGDDSKPSGAAENDAPAPQRGRGRGRGQGRNRGDRSSGDGQPGNNQAAASGADPSASKPASIAGQGDKRSSAGPPTDGAAALTSKPGGDS